MRGQIYRAGRQAGTDFAFHFSDYTETYHPGRRLSACMMLLSVD